MSAPWTEDRAVSREPVGEQPDGLLPDPARRAFVYLLTNRYVTRARQRNVWDALLTYEEEIRARLDEMFVELVIDRDLEVAFKRQMEGEDTPRVLRRDKPLSRDASFLLIFLRKECAYADPREGPAVVTRTQIDEFLRTFREEGDGDDARFARRVDAAINGLTGPLGLLIPDPEVDYLYTVSPVVVPLIGTDEMGRLEAAYRAAAEQGSPEAVAGNGVDTASGAADDTESGAEMGGTW